MAPSLYIRNILRRASASSGTTTPGSTSEVPEVVEAQPENDDNDQPFSMDVTPVDSSSEGEPASEFKNNTSPKSQQQHHQPQTPTTTLLSSSTVLEGTTPVSIRNNRAQTTTAASATTALPTGSTLATKKIRSSGEEHHQVPDVFVSKRVTTTAPAVRRQRRHSLDGGVKTTGGGGGGATPTLYSSVSDDFKADRQQEQAQQQQYHAAAAAAVVTPRRKKANNRSSNGSRSITSSWLSPPKNSPRKIALFFTGGGGGIGSPPNSKGPTHKFTGSNSSRHLKETSQPSVPTQLQLQQQHAAASFLSPTVQTRRPAVLNRGGQVTFTGQQAHAGGGRRTASTRNILMDRNDNEAVIRSSRASFVSPTKKSPRRPSLNRGGQATFAGGQQGRRAGSTRSVLNDNKDELNDSTRLMKDFNGSTRGLYASISSGLPIPNEGKGSDDHDKPAADADADVAPVDDDHENTVSNNASNSAVSEATASVIRTPTVLNLGGQVNRNRSNPTAGNRQQQAYFGHRAASMNNILVDYDNILTYFQDSARVLLPVAVDADNKSIVSKDASTVSKDVSIALSQAMVRKPPKMLNRGGQVGGGNRNSGSTTRQPAYFGHRAASMKNFVQDFHAILEEFHDSLNAPDSNSAGVVSMQSSKNASAHGLPGQPPLEENTKGTNNRGLSKATLNRGGQVTFPAANTTTGEQQHAYLGRRSASAQNILQSYNEILCAFNDSTLCLNDSARNGGSVWQSAIISSTTPGPPATAPPLKQKRRRNSIGGGCCPNPNHSANTDNKTTNSKALSATRPPQRRDAASNQKTAAAATTTARPQQATSRNSIGASNTNTGDRSASRPPQHHPRKQRRNSASGGSSSTNHATNNQALSASCHTTSVYRTSRTGGSDFIKHTSNDQEMTSASCLPTSLRRGISDGYDFKRAKKNHELSASCHPNTSSRATITQRQAQQRRNSVGGYDARAFVTQYEKLLRDFDDSCGRSRCTDDSWSLASTRSLETRSIASFALASPMAEQRKPVIGLSSLL